MGSCGSIYGPAGNSLDCSDRGEIMGGNGMKRGVLTARTRQGNIRDKSAVVIFTPPTQLTPGLKKKSLRIKYRANFNYILKLVKCMLIVGVVFINGS